MSEPERSRHLPEQLYDPELPCLEALEHEIRRRALRAARGAARVYVATGSADTAPHSHAATGSAAPGHAGERRQRTSLRGWSPPGRRRSSQTAARIARRTLTLVALLSLIGATAYGARAVFSGGSPNPAAVEQRPFVLVASGSSGGEHWTLRLYRRGGELCRVLVVAEAEASRCGPVPAPGQLGVTSVVSPQRRYLFGVTGDAVARVAVHVGEAAQTLTTYELSRRQARAGDLPPGARYFIGIVARPRLGADPPALVRPLDAAGRPTEPARMDCVEAAQPQSCEP